MQPFRNTLKAEFYKLFTVRSTYVITGLIVLMIMFFAGYIEGFRAAPERVADPNFLASEITSAIGAVAGIMALVGLLLVTHEYRYNTITYTLASSKSRTQVLLAKILVVSCYAILFSLFIAFFSPAMTYVGVQLKGLDLTPQIIPVWHFGWRAVFFGWAFSMVAMLIAMLVRSQVGAIVMVFVAPSAVEGILSILLKKNSIYMPFTALQQIISNSGRPPADAPAEFSLYLEPSKAALVFGIYLAVGWVIAWLLFVRRDAN
jgi:ABC-2 type transport system permease protein